jgi:ABC-type molybdate transport system substrate-binding protein
LWHGVCFFLSTEGTGVVLRVRSGTFSLIEERNMKHKFAVKAIVAALALAASAAGWGQTPPVIQDGCTDSQGVWNVAVCIGAVPTIKNALQGIPSISPTSLIMQYPGFSGLTIGTVYKPSDTLANDIADKLGATPPQDSPYDLYLAADTAGPASLTRYAQVATPVNYAEGTIMLWSNGDAYSINASLPPATFKATYTATGICNPNMGPYGRVAQTVLQEVYDIDPNPGTNPKIQTYPMITDVDAAIFAGGGVSNGVQSGWVPTALHCQGGAVFFDPKVYPNVTYQVFTPTQGEYPPAFQAGTAIDSSRSKQGLAQGFLKWIADTTGQSILQNFA